MRKSLLLPAVMAVGVLWTGIAPATANAETTYHAYKRKAHRKTVKRVGGGAVGGAAVGALAGGAPGAAIGAAAGAGAGYAYDRHKKHQGKP